MNTDPTGMFCLGGLSASAGISGTLGGLANGAIAAAQGKSADQIAIATGRGFLLGALFGGAGYGAAAAGLNPILAGAVLGGAEGGI